MPLRTQREAAARAATSGEPTNTLRRLQRTGLTSDVEQQLLKWKARPTTKLPPHTPVYIPPYVPLGAPVTKLRHLPAISLRSPHTSQVRSVTNLRSRRNVFLIALAAARRALLCVPPAPRVIGLGPGYGLSLSRSPSLA